MIKPMPFPPELLTKPFTPADAAIAGVTRARLDGPGLVRTTYGGRSTKPITDVQGRAAGVLVAVPPDVVISHRTAARLWGVPLARDWTPNEPVDLMRDTARPRLRRRGIVHHHGLEHRTVRTVHGIPVVSPEETWADLAETSGLEDLVVAGDFLIHHEHGLGRIEDVLRVVGERAGWPGTPLLRRAARLLRDRSASPMESRTRLVFVRGGLPEPELNVDVLSENGEWLAVGDFVWRRQRLVGEYDGDRHRLDPRRWQQTVGRREQLQDEGWRVITMVSQDIQVRPQQTLERFRRALHVC